MSQQQQQHIRKSKRTRMLTEKAKAETNTISLVNHKLPTTTTTTTRKKSFSLPKTKKRKISSIEEEEEAAKLSDKIDPVEKLLSLTNVNQDFLLDWEDNSHRNHHTSISSSSTSNNGITSGSLISSNTSNCGFSPRSGYHSSSSSISSLFSQNEESEIDEYDYDYESEDYEEPNEIESVNFTKIIQDNIRQYYVKRRLENQYKDSFALLNKQNHNQDDEEEENPLLSSASPTSNRSIFKQCEVPFFKSVNFGNKPKEYTIEDYFQYDNAEEEEEEEKKEEEKEDESKSVTTSEDNESNGVSPITTPKSTMQSLYIPKINNNYRRLPMNIINHNNITTNSCNNNNNLNNLQDLSKILNKNSIITGNASEMISAGNFMLTDFYL